MAFVPISYNLRSLVVRRGTTLLTVFSIGATIAVLAAVLSLQSGFQSVFSAQGRDDVAVVLRSGAGSEGESSLTLADVDLLTKSIGDFANGPDGQPLVSAETYLAVRRLKVGGGETNVALRGVQQATFAVHGDNLKIVEGRNFEPGSDEVIVGRRLLGRIAYTQLGDTLQINLTPFKVVGVFEGPGAFETEIWGDVERMKATLDRSVYNRVIGVLRDDSSAEQLNAGLEGDPRIAAKALAEKEYLVGQTKALSTLFTVLGSFLFVVMGIAAIFTGLNSIYSSIASRRREVGILLATGYRPSAIFLSFWLESAVIGLLGGVIGLLLTIPLSGLETGTTNFQTFSEVAFELRVTPDVIGLALLMAVLLGLVGGAWPSIRAARMEVTEAIRQS